MLVHFSGFLFYYSEQVSLYSIVIIFVQILMLPQCVDPLIFSLLHL